MVDNKFVLLLGNGINRTLEDDRYSSEKLLVYLVKTNSKFKCKQILEMTSFPLCFESICGATYPEKNSEDLMLTIMNYLKELSSTKNDLYKLIDINECYSIITTNYDLSIEHSLGLNKKTSSIRRNAGFKTENQGLIIYHIHGVINSKKHAKNICLGTVGYNKYCRSLQSGIPSQYNNICNDFVKYKAVLPEWAKTFFERDIHIVGLNLGESERDLWYILTLRSYLFLHGEKISNNIYFYDIIDSEADLKKEDKTKQVKIKEIINCNKAFYSGLNIKYIGKPLELRNYKEEYEEIFKNLFNCKI